MNISFKSRKGTAAVATALMMTLILGFCALVTDIGIMSIQKSRLQNAVDSAALAAAQDLPSTSEAAETVRTYLDSNGFGNAAIDISFAHNNRQVTVEAARTFDYMLAGVLGMGSVEVRASATAQKGGTYIRGAFEYAIFSGDRNQELILNSNGRDTYVEGSVHSNNGFRYNGNHDSLVITGVLDTVGRITLNSTHVDIGEQRPFSSYIEMPDFSEEIKRLARQNGTYYNTSQSFNGDLHVNEAIYVNGHINFNSSKFSGIGTIFATDNINFNNSVAYEGPGTDSICIYSQNGNIHFNNSGAVIRGTIYAPNGTVVLNNGLHTIYGRIIAQKIIFNGGIEVISSPGDLVFMEAFDNGIRLVR
ncbi:MAG TPA: pilus assembly protein TadG-related protein [Clostridiales bacterium]|nr:pilus assembly protein TadG-related protein [Clostridiales bacterium]